MFQHVSKVLKILHNMRYQIQNAISHIGHTGIHNLLSIIALALITLILNTFLFNHTAVFNELSLRETVAPLIAFANDTVVKEDAQLFADQIQKNDHILYIDYISKEENLNRAEKQFGLLGSLIKNGYSGSNPFPASLEIYVDSPNLTRKTLEEIAFDIESYDTIDDVILTGHGILTDIYHQTNRMTVASIAISILLSLVLIRASVLKTGRIRHKEIQLLNNLGATRGYLRMPFIIQGIFLGLCGTIIGLICFYSLYCLFTFQLGVLEFLPYYQLISVVVVGVVFGLFAGISAYRMYVKSCRKMPLV